MTPLERMKDSAAASNSAMHRATGAGQKRKIQPTRNGTSKAVLRRQEAVRKLLGEGLNVSQIAVRLRVNPSTIKGDVMALRTEDANADRS